MSSYRAGMRGNKWHGPHATSWHSVTSRVVIIILRHFETFLHFYTFAKLLYFCEKMTENASYQSIAEYLYCIYLVPDKEGGN